MQAAVLIENGVIVSEDRPLHQPAQDEYLVKIDAVGVCNSDIFRAHANGCYEYPLVMGHEISGEIVEAGAGVSELQTGQKVVVFPLLPCRTCESCMQEKWAQCADYSYYGSRQDGGYQEYIAVKEWNLLPIPNQEYSLFHCLTEPVAVGMHAVDSVPGTVDDKRVAIFGAGIIGLTIATALAEKGAQVVVLDRNDFKLDLIKEYGLETLNSQKDEVQANAFDIVFEATGAIEIYRKSLQLCKAHGIVIWLGNIHGDLTIPQKEVSSILRKELTIKGVWNSDYQRGVADDWGRAIKFISTHPIIDRLVNRQIPLTELGDTLQTLFDIKNRTSQQKIIKAMVNFAL